MEGKNKNTCIKILVVDDDAFDSKVLVGRLTEEGYSKIETVVNGEEAIKSIWKFNPDVILMDSEMGTFCMKGYEACREIRELGYGGDEVRIIGLSPNPAYEKFWGGAGADHFVVKGPMSDYLGNICRKIREFFPVAEGKGGEAERKS